MSMAAPLVSVKKGFSVSIKGDERLIIIMMAFLNNWRKNNVLLPI